jgi:hypothetical protein
MIGLSSRRRHGPRPGSGPGCRRIVARARAFPFVLLLVTTTPLLAQEGATDVPRVYAALEGTWEGTGTLLGQPTAFDMTWGPLVGGFVRLSFANAWVDDTGARTTVLRAEAIYLARGPRAAGVWIDSRPARIRLEAIVSDTSIVTMWTADAERGRTDYIVREPEEVLVRDFVEVDGALREFGEAVYRRADSARRIP